MSTARRHGIAAFALLVCSTGFLGARIEAPETVMVTFHARPGAEDTLARAIAQHWDVARRLNLVTENPHVTLRGVEDGKTYYVDIFTWRDASIPDSAPPAIQVIWKEMNRLVEARGGRPGLEFREMFVVPGK